IAVSRSYATLAVAVFALVQMGASAGEPHVSFRRDVAPVLTTSCSTRSCHGGMRSPMLGAKDDAAKLRASLLTEASDEQRVLPFVRPGAPDKSWLVAKVEGHLEGHDCVDHDCGDAMPLDNPSLSPENIRTIRSWIAQGAQDN
ncbi:MAG: hypothetical protein ABI551_03330, partial [Polyangiaceae bacterium]